MITVIKLELLVKQKKKKKKRKFFQFNLFCVIHHAVSSLLNKYIERTLRLLLSLIDTRSILGIPNRCEQHLQITNIVNYDRDSGQFV